MLSPTQNKGWGVNLKGEYVGMTSKRMFNMAIVDSDAFLEMPISSQLLYFHLGMRADDDGFIANAKKIIKVCNCSNDDLSILIAKNFLIPFKSGVVAIKHWRMNNNKPDTAHYHPTNYKEEYNALYIKENKSYTINGSEGIALGDYQGLLVDTDGVVCDDYLKKNAKD